LFPKLDAREAALVIDRWIITAREPISRVGRRNLNLLMIEAAPVCNRDN
jgi:hypothetical protein